MDSETPPQFTDADLSRAVFRNVNLTGAKFKEAMLVNVRMSGLIDGLVVNEVEVAPLIVAELDRRHPERTRLRPADADGVRDAWSVIEGLWDATMARAGGLPPERLRQRVDDEWSFLETVRHLVFVTDLWVSQRVFNSSGHFHPFGMPPSFITDPSPFGIDLAANPSLDEVASARDDRMDIVRSLVRDLDNEGLRRQCGDQTVRSCLLTVFDEEWHHNWFANRDLDVLED
jgi:hypothetical protein